MRIAAAIFLSLLMGLPALPKLSHAQGMGPMGPHGMGHGMYRGGPYGNYCPGMQWGPYGVRKPVRSAEEARRVVETYIAGNTEGVHAGKIEEKNWYFEAEILDRGDAVIDKVIVDRRTGRIRSIY